MNYMDTRTGTVYTEQEIREAFEMFKDEMYPDGDALSFEEYMDGQLLAGKYGADGFVEAYWYACMVDNEDNDWGTGSYDLKEAKEWVEKNCDSPDAHIAVIREGDDPICVDIISREDF